MMAPAHPRILVEHLAMDVRVGVHAWEKTAPQPVLIDVELDLHGDRACRTDVLSDAVDYGEVIAQLRRVGARPHTLVEAMAESMCQAVLQDPRVARMRLRLLKLAPFPGARVGVEIVRVPSDSRPRSPETPA